MKRFLINVIFIVIGLPFYLTALILIVYASIMRFCLLKLLVALNLTNG